MLPGLSSIKAVDVKKIKEEIREQIWITLDARGVARFPKPIFNRIPNFIGATTSAVILSLADFFERSRVVEVGPDTPQSYVRRIVLEKGKILVVPSPRLQHGFILIDPARYSRSEYGSLVSIRSFMEKGEKVDPWDLPKIDLFVVGSVAVNFKGARVGKGGGFSDLEYAILREFNKVSEDTPVVTNVHELQIVDMEIPMEKHDLPVDFIVSQSRIYKTKRVYRKPEGIYWDQLKISEEFRDFIEKIRRYLRR
ncbi:MAG: 5-formyltetrahydrofolate cyclo-ligase [Sulfolobales archaeon]